MTLDPMRLVVTGGDGLVARYPRVVLGIDALAGGAQVERLVSLARSFSGGELDVAALGGALRASELFEAPPFALLAQRGDTLHLFVRGSAELSVSASEYDIKIGRRPPVALVERSLKLPVRSIASARADSTPDLQAWLDLRRGVVPGAGFVLRQP